MSAGNRSTRRKPPTCRQSLTNFSVTNNLILNTAVIPDIILNILTFDTNGQHSTWLMTKETTVVLPLHISCNIVFYIYIYLYSHHQMTQVQRRHRHNYIQYIQYIHNIRTQETRQLGGHTLSFMIRINLHRLVRFSLFVDAIIPKKLMIFGLFVYLFLI